MCIAVSAYLSDLYILRRDTRLYDLPLVRLPQIKISFAIGGFVVDIPDGTAEGVPQPVR